jgi:quercetin dioxygenase-like cupin family protein
VDAANIDSVELTRLTSSTTEDAEWSGGYLAYGGGGAEKSVVVYFAIPPGERLGRHTDAAEETQFIVSGSGELLLDAGPRPVAAGDLIVLTIGTGHDLRTTGSEELRVLGFFAAPQVEQHWTTEVWEPGGLDVTGTPNR